MKLNRHGSINISYTCCYHWMTNVISVSDSGNISRITHPSSIGREPRIGSRFAVSLIIGSLWVLLHGCTLAPDAVTGVAPTIVIVPPAVPPAVERDASPQGPGDAREADADVEDDQHRSTVSKVEGAWGLAAQRMALPHHLDQLRVRQEFGWFERNPEYFARTSARASRYLPFILDEVEKRGIPGEIALLPIVESAYDPFAYSHGRAMGLWQFIPGTARRFGLQMNWWYDGRRDIVASTHAALDYLEYLHGLFDGDWMLALAAYNSGEGTVRNAQRRQQRAGKPDDFWSLALPAETRAYVPRLLAVSHYVRTHDDLPTLPLTARFRAIELQDQTDLAVISRLADVPLSQLYRLNPGLNRWATPNGGYTLLVPPEVSPELSSLLQGLADGERMRLKRHKIRYGESLSVIAAQYGTSVDALRRVNQVRNSTIRTGEHLLVPTASQHPSDYALSAANRHADATAYRHEKMGTPVTYRVESGDSLWLIAQRHGVAVRALASWNGLAPTDVLRVGKTINIWGGSQGAVAAPVVAHGHERATRRVNYRVRRGESLAVIAGKFNLSVSDIRGWNGAVATSRYIHPGQQLTLFVDVTKTRRE